MEKTAVEFLLEKIIWKDQYHEIYLYPTITNEIIEQAKEMENQYKLECFIEGYKQRAEGSNLVFDDISKTYATDLFNKTFNK
jgi:hypothetical protein